MPPRVPLSPPFSAAQGRENAAKGSWIEIKTGGGHSAMAVMGKTDST